MFNKPTLIILGAGASLDYGYPLGKDLIDRIISNQDQILHKYSSLILEAPELLQGNLKQHIEGNFKKIKDIISGLDGFQGQSLAVSFETTRVTRDVFNDDQKRELKFILNKAPLDEENIKIRNPIYASINVFLGSLNKHLDVYNKYILALIFFQRLREFDPVSIDFFLSVHTEFEYTDKSGNKTNIGKFAIAYEIMKCTGGDLDKRSKRAIKNEEENSNWYKYLLNELLSGSENGRQVQLKKNALSIVTFNYDVSLEKFLEKKLTNMSYFKEKRYDLRFLERLNKNLIHVYGKVCPQPISKDEKYTLENISNNIKVIGEDRKIKNTKSDICKIQTIIRNSEKIFILGYAFDQRNNNLIGLEEAFQVDEDLCRQTNYIFLKREVVITNYNNSKIINLSIQRMIFNHISDNYLSQGDGPRGEGVMSETPEGVDLSKIKNLTITDKSLGEAIGSDFDFSDYYSSGN